MKKAKRYAGGWHAWGPVVYGPAPESPWKFACRRCGEEYFV